tara:strand:- start:48128 stop:48886 length:759 start_codon:yes stop_codon:yes gene_type:complete
MDKPNHNQISFDLVRLHTVSSTNEELKMRAINENAPEGLAIASTIQTSGKGRHGRVWESEAGNMYCSVLLRPNCDLSRASQLGFLAALASSQAIISYTGDLQKLDLKWPNDVLLNNKKVGGVLLETINNKNKSVDWVILGCGVNLQQHPMQTAFPATSVIRELGIVIEPKEFVNCYLNKLMEWYKVWVSQGFFPVRSAWLKMAFNLNKKLLVKAGDQNIVGIFQDLDEEGALIVKTINGFSKVNAGEVYFHD